MTTVKLKLDKYQAKFKTGDVIAIRGHTRAMSSILSFLAASEVTHAGVVWRKKDGTVHVIHTLIGRGLHDVPLKEFLAYGSLLTIVRPLRDPLSEEGSRRFDAWYKEMKGTPYETSVFRFVSSSDIIESIPFAPLFQREADGSSMFCSEAVADALKAVGLISSDVDSERIEPKDFATENRFSGFMSTPFVLDYKSPNPIVSPFWPAFKWLMTSWMPLNPCCPRTK